MTTSGSADFTMNRDQIITVAMENCGALAAGETISAEDLASCALRLNMMVKSWMKQGMHLWALSEATLFLGVGTQTYSLGATGTHCTDSYVHTTLSAAAATSAVSLSLTSIVGMSASDHIGIVLDDGTIHWTTISGSPGSPTTIANGLPSAASSGAVVFAYTTKINRPQRILSAYRRSIAGSDTPIEVSARQDYADLSNKLVEGKTNRIFYDPQLTNGVLYAWPTPDLATDVIRFWYERPLQDFDALTDNPDFPIEWAEAICAGLSYRMAGPLGVDAQRKAELKADAEIMLDAALSFDREDVSIQCQPDIRR